MVLIAKEKSYSCIVSSIVVGQICYKWNNNTIGFRGFVPANTNLNPWRTCWSIGHGWLAFGGSIIQLSCSTYSIALKYG